MSDCSLLWHVFEAPSKWCIYSSIWLRLGRCHEKLPSSWHTFSVHHTTMHQFFSLRMLSIFCVHKLTHERKTTTTTTKHLLISNLCWCVPYRTRRSRIIQCSRKLSSKCICFVVSCLHPCLLFSLKNHNTWLNSRRINAVARPNQFATHTN